MTQHMYIYITVSMRHKSIQVILKIHFGLQDFDESLKRQAASVVLGLVFVHTSYLVKHIRS